MENNNKESRLEGVADIQSKSSTVVGELYRNLSHQGNRSYRFSLLPQRHESTAVCKACGWLIVLGYKSILATSFIVKKPTESCLTCCIVAKPRFVPLFTALSRKGRSCDFLSKLIIRNLSIFSFKWFLFLRKIHFMFSSPLSCDRSLENDLEVPYFFVREDCKAHFRKDTFNRQSKITLGFPCNSAGSTDFSFSCTWTLKGTEGW